MQSTMQQSSFSGTRVGNARLGGAPVAARVTPLRSAAGRKGRLVVKAEKVRCISITRSRRLAAHLLCSFAQYLRSFVFQGGTLGDVGSWVGDWHRHRSGGEVRAPAGLRPTCA
jgi:hypothetical protein